MLKHRIWAVIILLAAVGLGFFVFSSEKNKTDFAFEYGLDLTGGTHLVYKAQTQEIPSGERDEAMRSLRDVIERRVNLFGVSEPIVQVEKSILQDDDRLIVELPGVTDVEEAVKRIGQTPVLEFRLGLDISDFTEEEISALTGEDFWQYTGLTGRLVKRAQVSFEGGATGVAEPAVLLTFNDEGAELFASITRDNTGQVLGIFLDGILISDPVIREEIPTGTAVISGNFNAQDARELVRDLNFGALPVPVELISTESIGPTLGKEALQKGLKAGAAGLFLVVVFMLLWYRLPGLVAVLSLSVYLVLMLAVFKLVPVVLTAAGVAGFIISIGMAVDANILIFERLKEEIREGKTGAEAVHSAFKRAWLAIRDGNLTSILTAIVLFYAGTFLTQSFALTFGMGVLLSMLTAVTITRTFLLAIVRKSYSGN